MSDEELRGRLQDLHQRVEKIERQDYTIGFTNLSFPLLYLGCSFHI